MTTPRPRAVAIGSLTLFVVLFAVLTFELSASASTKAQKTQAAAKSRPAPTEAGTGSAPEVVEEVPSEFAEPAEPESEYVEPEPEYEEPAYAEPEYVEPEIEEAPPVVTASS